MTACSSCKYVAYAILRDVYIGMGILPVGPFFIGDTHVIPCCTYRPTVFGEMVLPYNLLISSTTLLIDFLLGLLFGRALLCSTRRVAAFIAIDSTFSLLAVSA